MNEINPNHAKQRAFLRVLGPAVLLVGGILVAIGFISFFSAFSGHGHPGKFWCAMIGMPVSFVGIALCKFGYMGKIALYTAGELAPVGRDTINYMGRETQAGVADFSEAIHIGKSRADGQSIEDRIRKLEQMKQSGLINEEDFEEQKDRILSEL